MKMIKLRKIVTSSLIVAAVLTLNSIAVSAEWKSNITGWQNINEEWYYFDNVGHIKTGWLNDNGKYYYLNQNGVMSSNTSINGYYLGEDGAWTEKAPANNVISEDKTNSEDDITMKTEKSIYEIGTNEIRIYITNSTNKEHTYGETYEVEKFENNQWNEVPFKDDMTFNAIACIISPNETTYEVIKLHYCKEILKSGKYRIVKLIDNLKLTSEFEILPECNN